MRAEEQKMALSAQAAAEVQAAQASVADEFLAPGRMLPNVVGMGVGVKWKGGAPTGEPALLVLVTQKRPREELGRAELVPAKLADMQTDVLAVGYPMAGVGQPAAASGDAAKRARPARGGYSVGHVRVTAGTIGTCVYDLLPDSSTNPPRHGVGIPARYYILSNNHVLAASNSASIGDPVLQPGPYDGGSDPADRIGTLSRFVPIEFDPPAARSTHNNLVDAAVAEGHFFELDRSIHWIGRVQAWVPKQGVTVGTLVQKTGRSTGYTVGRITAINATLDVGYGGGRVARFKDQIVTTCMSASGDSGSIVLNLEGAAVGLLFAGSTLATVVNQIEHVRALLRVEVAERAVAVEPAATARTRRRARRVAKRA